MLKSTINQPFNEVKLPVNNIQAIQTTRYSPVSKKKSYPSKNVQAFDDFNLGLHVGDDENQVIHHRQLLHTFLPTETNIQWLDQVHGNNVVVIEQMSLSPIKADAVITREPKLALAIMTADCLPILLSNSDGTEVAAIHAGWRSLAGNIIDNTVNKMLSDNGSIHAWLGPCISQTHFEVGTEVKDIFEQLNGKFCLAFQVNENENDKWLADLQHIALMMLKDLGIASIEVDAGCTFSQKRQYYSYRRENITGRMASLICIK